MWASLPFRDIYGSPQWVEKGQTDGLAGELVQHGLDMCPYASASPWSVGKTDVQRWHMNASWQEVGKENACGLRPACTQPPPWKWPMMQHGCWVVALTQSFQVGCR